MPTVHPPHYNLPVYSAELLDIQNPRNAGEVEAPDATANWKNPAWETFLNSRSIGSNRITDIRFRAKVAFCDGLRSASRSWSQAKMLTRPAREPGKSWRKVGGLPQASAHAGHWRWTRSYAFAEPLS